ncbi:MAG: hypothetical protein ILP07_05745 [Treponema sp.]|nr:hypothetical protein [Treponema sp.]
MISRTIEEIRVGNWADDQEITEDVDEDGYAKPLEPESLITRSKFNVQAMAQMAGLDVKVDYDLLEKADKLERTGK